MMDAGAARQCRDCHHRHPSLLPATDHSHFLHSLACETLNTADLPPLKSIHFSDHSALLRFYFDWPGHAEDPFSLIRYLGKYTLPDLPQRSIICTSCAPFVAS